MSQRKLTVTAATLGLLIGGLGICIVQIAGAGHNPDMLLSLASRLIDAVQTIVLGYLGANVLDKAQGVVEALRKNNEANKAGEENG